MFVRADSLLRKPIETREGIGMNTTIYLIAVIAVIAIVTWALRAFPFLLFSSRPLPKTVQYLGKVLPPAIMTVLVIYCLRDTNM